MHTIVDKSLINFIFSNKISASHKLVKLDYALYFTNKTKTLYYNNITICYDYNARFGEIFIKIIDYSDIKNTVTSYFKIINIKRKKYLLALFNKLLNMNKLTKINTEYTANTLLRVISYTGTDKQGYNYRLDYNYYKPCYYGEFEPIEISCVYPEGSTILAKQIIKYLNNYVI